jgi:branched-chain amino acid transport system substrate-binding protein
MKTGVTLSIALMMAAPAVAAESWDVGIIAPTTGALSTVGTRQLSAVEWWAHDVNARGGIRGRLINLIHCNDEASPEKSATCTRDLIGRKVVLLLNASITGPILAAMPLLQNGPVMVTPSPNVVPPANSYVFQTSPSDLELTKGIAAYARKNGVDHIAMVAATDASGEVGVKSAAAVFLKEGITYKLARIDLRASDASIQLTNVVSDGAPLIYSNYSGGGAATVVKSYSNFGLDNALLVSYANISDSFINLIKDDMPKRLLAVGLKAAAPDLVTDATERAHLDYFAKSYLAWKKDPIDHLSILGLTMADFAAAILEHVDDPGKPADVRSYAESYPIPSVATLHFSAQSHVGLSADDVAVLEYRKGHWEKAGPLK